MFAKHALKSQTGAYCLKKNMVGQTPSYGWVWAWPSHIGLRLA